MENRCDLGLLIARDYLEYIENEYTETVEGGDKGGYIIFRRSAWYEFMGDLRTIARRDDADEAYDKAEEIYHPDGDISLVEHEHNVVTGFFRGIREAVESDIPPDSPEYRPAGPSFLDWLELKREMLPELLEQLEEEGEWIKNEDEPSGELIGWFED